VAIVFPTSPSIGQELSGGGFTWIWSGSAWEKVASASVGGGGNGFYLYVGTDGNTNFELVSPQPAGSYFITSEKDDSTYDIYAINASGDLVGYTTEGRLIATDEIVRISVVGTTTDDTLKFETKATTFTVSSNNIDDGAPVFASSATPSLLESFNDTTTIIGGNFSTDVTVDFTGSDLVVRAAKNIVRTSSSELVVTRPDDMPPTFNPYTITVLNPGIPLPTQAPAQHILTSAISAGTFASWITNSPLFWEKGDTTVLSLVAQDVESSDIDYSIVSGSLFAEFSIDEETGQITGDDSLLADADEAIFTVRATDTAGNTTEKTFEMYINRYPVYSMWFDPMTMAGNLEEFLLYEYSIEG
jgi:hypothetical protein